MTEKFLRTKEAMRHYPGGRTSFLAAVKKGDFPRPVKVSGINLWSERVIMTWKKGLVSKQLQSLKGTRVMPEMSELRPLTEFPDAAYLLNVITALFSGKDKTSCINVCMAVAVHCIVSDDLPDEAQAEIIENICRLIRENYASQSAAYRLRDASNRAADALEKLA